MEKLCCLFQLLSYSGYSSIRRFAYAGYSFRSTFDWRRELICYRKNRFKLRIRFLQFSTVWRRALDQCIVQIGLNG